MPQTKKRQPLPCLPSSSSSSSSEEEEYYSSNAPEQDVNEEEVQTKNSDGETRSQCAPKRAKNKLPFQRVWGEDAEIALLESACSFKAHRNVDPLAHIHSFYEFSKERGITGFTKRQVREKYKRLMKRFLNKGKCPVFKQDHEQKMYYLCTKIWSRQVNEPPKIVSKKKKKKKKKQQQQLKTEHNSLSGIEEMVLSEGIEVIARKEKAKAEGLKERWRSLRVAELELFLVRNQLVHDQAQLCMDSYKSDKL